jgi:hypothetical protein
MHIPDGFISPLVAATTGGFSVRVFQQINDPKPVIARRNDVACIPQGSISPSPFRAAEASPRQGRRVHPGFYSSMT